MLRCGPLLGGFRTLAECSVGPTRVSRTWYQRPRCRRVELLWQWMVHNVLGFFLLRITRFFRPFIRRQGWVTDTHRSKRRVKVGLVVIVSSSLVSWVTFPKRFTFYYGKKNDFYNDFKIGYTIVNYPNNNDKNLPSLFLLYQRNVVTPTFTTGKRIHLVFLFATYKNEYSPRLSAHLCLTPYCPASQALPHPPTPLSWIAHVVWNNPKGFSAPKWWHVTYGHCFNVNTGYLRMFKFFSEFFNFSSKPSPSKPLKNFITSEIVQISDVCSWLTESLILRSFFLLSYFGLPVSTPLTSRVFPARLPHRRSKAGGDGYPMTSVFCGWLVSPVSLYVAAATPSSSTIPTCSRPFSLSPSTVENLTLYRRTGSCVPWKGGFVAPNFLSEAERES